MGLILEILKVGGCIYLKYIYQSIHLAIHTFIHPSVFVCPSVSLFVFLPMHCFKCNLDNLQSAFLFAHLRNVVFTIFTSKANDSVCLFYHIYEGVTNFFSQVGGFWEFNPRTYTQIHTPTVVQRGEGAGWIEPIPAVFDMLQYFETIVGLVESLWSS